MFDKAIFTAWVPVSETDKRRILWIPENPNSTRLVVPVFGTSTPNMIPHLYKGYIGRKATITVELLNAD